MAVRKQRPRSGKHPGKGEPRDPASPESVQVSHWVTWLPWLCLAAFLVPTWHNVLGWVSILKYPGDANFGEGTLLYEGWRLAHGKSIYLDPALPPFWISTYPPLYQLLIALTSASSLLWPRLL